MFLYVDYRIIWRNVRAFYAPFCRIEIVSSASEILYEANRDTLKCEHEYACWRFSMEDNGFVSEIVYSRTVVDFYSWIRLPLPRVYG